MLWGAADFLWVTDRPALRLGNVLANRGYHSGLSCLIAYAEMSSANLNRNRINYKIRPKWCLHTIEYSFSADVDTSHGLYFLFFKLVEPYNF
jgi:hypothetical protein